MSNLFLELITKGADISQEDFKCIQNLCKCITELFTVEERLMKINAPCTVIGDILGNMAPVETIYRLICKSVPVLQSNIVFLGNYISSNGNDNLEVIAFIFSLKVQMPNKVILLRGFNENVKEAQRILLPECKRKYGDIEIAQLVCDAIVEAFTRMPFCVIIDESILCLHSGIPSKSSGNKIMNFFENIPNIIENIEDCFPAYEV